MAKTTTAFVATENLLFKRWEDFWTTYKIEKAKILKAFRSANKKSGLLEFHWNGFLVCDPITNTRLEPDYIVSEGSHPLKTDFFALLAKMNKKYKNQPFYIVVEAGFTRYENHYDKINRRELGVETDDFVTVELYRNYND